MKLLIVVDMQNDFVFDALANKDAEAILANIKEKIETYLENGDAVIFTQDTHQENYLETAEGKMLPVPHCIRGSKGWQIVEALQPYVKKADVLEKPTFGYTEWKTFLKSIDKEADEIELVGVCTDICVVSNAMILKAAYPETPISVDLTCCAATTPEKQLATAAVLESCQVTTR